MPGTVIRVLVEKGAQVVARQPLLVLEAMKMETPLVSPHDGVVEPRARGRGRPRRRGRSPDRARKLISPRRVSKNITHRRLARRSEARTRSADHSALEATERSIEHSAATSAPRFVRPSSRPGLMTMSSTIRYRSTSSILETRKIRWILARTAGESGPSAARSFPIRPDSGPRKASPGHEGKPVTDQRENDPRLAEVPGPVDGQDDPEDEHGERGSAGRSSFRTTQRRARS